MADKTKFEKMCQKNSRWIIIIIIVAVCLGVWYYRDRQQSEAAAKVDRTRHFLSTVRDYELSHFIDDWGHKFRVIEGQDAFGERCFLLSSAGPDGLFDTADDIESIRWMDNLALRQSRRPSKEPTSYEQEQQLYWEVNPGAFNPKEIDVLSLDAMARSCFFVRQPDGSFVKRK